MTRLPVASIVSRDLSLKEKLQTVTRGQWMTAVEIQAALAELAGEFVAEGLAAGTVPDAALIVQLWQEVVGCCAGGNSSSWPNIRIAG